MYFDITSRTCNLTYLLTLGYIESYISSNAKIHVILIHDISSNICSRSYDTSSNICIKRVFRCMSYNISSNARTLGYMYLIPSNI